MYRSRITGRVPERFGYRRVPGYPGKSLMQCECVYIGSLSEHEGWILTVDEVLRKNLQRLRNWTGRLPLRSCQRKNCLRDVIILPFCIYWFLALFLLKAASQDRSIIAWQHLLTKCLSVLPKWWGTVCI